MTSASLPQDTGDRSENTPSYPGTGMIFCLTDLSRVQDSFKYRIGFVNISINSRKQKTQSVVRFSAHDQSSDYLTTFCFIGRLALDKAAANRFIKSAISSIQFTSQRPPGQDEGMPEAGGSTAKIPIRVTSKMIARAEYEKELKEAGSEEEDELEVFNDEEDDADMAVDDEQEKEDVTSDQGKGKGRALDPDSEGTRKRRRVAMDPFDGSCGLGFLSGILVS